MTLTLHSLRFGSGFDSLGDVGHLPFRVGFQQWQVEGQGGWQKRDGSGALPPKRKKWWPKIFCL